MSTADWLFWGGVFLLVAGSITVRVTPGKIVYIIGLLCEAAAAISYDRGARGLVPAALMLGVVALMLVEPQRLGAWLRKPFGKKERERDAGKEVDEGQVDGVGSEEAQGREE